MPMYCEAAPFFALAEPINALSNLAIIAAAAALVSILIRRRVHLWYFYALVALLFIGGIGSFLWHGFPSPITLMLDAVPTGVFYTGFLLTWGWLLYNARGVAAVIVCYFAAQVLAAVLFSPDALNGSVQYVVALAAGAVLLALTLARFPHLWIAGGAMLSLFAGSIAARTLDAVLCPLIPFGTHFLWHLGLAAASYVGITFLLHVRENTKKR